MYTKNSDTCNTKAVDWTQGVTFIQSTSNRSCNPESAGSVRDRYAGKGGDETWCIQSLQPQRLSLCDCSSIVLLEERTDCRHTFLHCHCVQLLPR